MKMIAAYSSDRDNNFNLIRFLAAWLVILAHSYTLKGADWSKLSVFKFTGIDPGLFAVDVFFVTSGFLISMSFLRQTNVLQYVGARIARIYPGLIMAVLFSALVIGPLFTTTSLPAYFSDRTVYEFIFINSALILDITQLRYALPGVFIANPYTQAVNGSLWTLPYEMWMYIFLMFIGVLGGLKNRKWFNIFYLIFAIEFCITLRFLGHLAIAQRLEVYQRYASLFLTGTFFYVNREFIPINWFSFPVALLVFLATRTTILRPVAYPLCLAYGVFWFAFIPAGLIRAYNKLGDYSYGLYVYAFPVQQGLIAAIPNISIDELLIASSLIALFFAMVSWYIIEKPALQHKGFLYGMVARWAQRLPVLRNFV